MIDQSTVKRLAVQCGARGAFSDLDHANVVTMFTSDQLQAFAQAVIGSVSSELKKQGEKEFRDKLYIQEDAR